MDVKAALTTSDGSEATHTNHSPVVVSWRTRDVTALRGLDYEGLSGEVTIPLGSTSASLTGLSVSDDDVYDVGDETFEIVPTLAGSSDVELSSSSTGIVTIVDDEVVPSLSLLVRDSEGMEISEDVVEEESSAGYLVSGVLSVGVDEDVEVLLSASGTATSSDYDLSSDRLYFGSGLEGSSSVVLTMKDDSSSDGGETIILGASVSSPSSLESVGDASRTLTILDAERPSARLTGGPRSVTESGSVRTLTYLRVLGCRRRRLALRFRMRMA